MDIYGYKGLMPTGLVRTSLGHCSLTLFTFLRHMQLIKFWQNFKALTMLWIGYEFYVLHEVSLKLATHKG